MVKRRDNMASIRNGIVAAVVVLVAALAVFGLYYGLGGGSDDAPFAELDRPGGSGDVEVVSFFSYTCPHCRSFPSTGYCGISCGSRRCPWAST